MSLSIGRITSAGALLAVVSQFWLVPEARAQVLPVTWSIQVPAGAIVKGQRFTALVRAQIPYGWHLYSATQPPGGPAATSFAATGTIFTIRGAVAAREPDRAPDPTLGITNETYDDSVTFRVPVVAVLSGRQSLEIKVAYQSCTNRFCAPQRIETVKAALLVAPAPKKK